MRISTPAFTNIYLIFIYNTLQPRLCRARHIIWLSHARDIILNSKAKLPRRCDILAALWHAWSHWCYWAVYSIINHAQHSSRRPLFGRRASSTTIQKYYCDACMIAIDCELNIAMCYSDMRHLRKHILLFGHLFEGHSSNQHTSSHFYHSMHAFFNG